MSQSLAAEAIIQLKTPATDTSDNSPHSLRDAVFLIMTGTKDAKPIKEDLCL